MSKPTRADAELLLKFYEIFRSDKDLKDAQWWFFNLEEISYEDFKSNYPAGSEGRRRFIHLSSFYEILGVLVNNGLLGEHLVFDLFGSLLWSKAEPIVHGMRKEMGWTRLFENYEVLAKRYPEWAKKNPPKV